MDMRKWFKEAQYGMMAHWGLYSLLGGEWNGKNKFGLFDKYDEFTPEDQPFFAQVQLVVTHRGDWWKRVTAGSEHPVNPDSVELPPYLPDDARVRRGRG